MELLQEQEGMSEATGPWEKIRANLGLSLYVLVARDLSGI